MIISAFKQGMVAHKQSIFYFWKYNTYEYYINIIRLFTHMQKTLISCLKSSGWNGIKKQNHLTE